MSDKRETLFRVPRLYEPTEPEADPEPVVTIQKPETPWTAPPPRRSQRLPYGRKVRRVALSKPPRKERPEQVVYFIEVEPDVIKIGTTCAIEQRLKSLQTAHLRPLKVLLTLPGGYVLEASLHERFDACHLDRELFRAHPELREFIASHVTTDNAHAPKAP